MVSRLTRSFILEPGPTGRCERAPSTPGFWGGCFTNEFQFVRAREVSPQRPNRVKGPISRCEFASQHDDKCLKTIILNQTGFESVDVQSDHDEDGNEILVVQIVFDGKQRALDPQKTSSLTRHLRPRIADIGVYAFPVISFVSKSDLGKRAAAVA